MVTRRSALHVLFLSILLTPILTITAALPASAADAFDFIYIDRYRYTFGYQGTVGTLVVSFGLLANTTFTPLSDADLRTIAFSIPAPAPGLTFYPFRGMEIERLAPVAPSEVVGRVYSGFNSQLMNGLEVGEVFRHTPEAVFGLNIERADGLPVGDYTQEIEMRMSNARVVLPFTIEVRYAEDPNLEFLSIRRVSAVANPSAGESTSWGQVKALYR